MTNPPPAPKARPFPDAPIAFLLTLASIFMGGLIGFLFLDFGLIAAEGIGTALGIGGIATLAARRVAEPQAARLGLVSLDLRALPLVLALVPAVLVASELDNFAYDADAALRARVEAARSTSAAPAAAGEGGEVRDEEAERTTTEESASANGSEKQADREADDEALAPRIDPEDPFSVLEGLVVVVGIAPVVHEFLFRGVLQQGLVAQLGLARGVTLAALLWTMLRPVPSTSPARFAAAFIAWFALGWLLGMLRIATGSILGPILLASLWATVGYVALVVEGRIALPGLNVDGTHVPPVVLALSIVLVAWGTRRVRSVALLAARSGGLEPERR